MVRLNRIAFLTLLVLAACTKAVPTKVVKVAPPPLPHIDQHVEPVVAAIPAELPRVNFNDPVDLAILEAQLRFERGESLYRQGFLKRAKDEFDGAVDLVLETAAAFPKERRLQHELTDLVARINAMELTALREIGHLPSLDQSDAYFSSPSTSSGSASLVAEASLTYRLPEPFSREV